MRKLLTLIVLPIALVAAMSGSATARPNRDASLIVNTVGDGARLASGAPAGSSLVFSGCGYTPGVDISVNVQSPSALALFQGAVANSDGCFSTEATWIYVAQEAGSYQALTYQSSKRKADATVTFTIAP